MIWFKTVRSSVTKTPARKRANWSVCNSKSPSWTLNLYREADGRLDEMRIASGVSHMCEPIHDKR